MFMIIILMAISMALAALLVVIGDNNPLVDHEFEVSLSHNAGWI